MKKYIPNILTTIRILTIPFIIYFFIINNYHLCFYLCIIGCISDALDGYLSRKWNVVSDIGKTLDTVADKLFAGSILIIFSFENPILIINIFLELIISIINIYYKYKKSNPKTLFIGKIKTFILFSFMLLLFLTKFLCLCDYIWIIMFVITTLIQIETIRQYKSFH